MYSSSRALGWPSLLAGGTLAPATAIKLDTTARQVVQSTSGDACMGIMQLGMRDFPGGTGSDTTIAAILGDTNFDFFTTNDYCQVLAINAFTPGQWAKSSTGGKATPHTTGASFVLGQVTDSCAAGDLVHIMFQPQYVSL